MGLLKSASLRYAYVQANPGLSKGGLRVVTVLSLGGFVPPATAGSPYNFTPSVSNGTAPYSFALTGTLPVGLSFSTSTGAITGTPTTVQTKAGLNITVTDATGATASLGVFSLAVQAHQSQIIPSPSFVAGLGFALSGAF